MSKLVFFGDSFFASPQKWRYFLDTHKAKPEKHWSLARLIASQLNERFHVLAESGSSQKFTFQKFNEYTTSPLYKEDDTFCIVTTSRNRFTDPVKFLHIAGSDSLEREIRENKNKAANAKHFEEQKVYLENIFYLEKNKDHIDWYCSYANNYPIDMDLLGFVSFIKTFSLTHKNKICVINAFEMNERTSTWYNSIENTEKFTRVYVDGGLFKHSVQEFDVKDCSEIKWDDERRANHFSPENRKILAEMLVEVIKTGNSDLFDITKFQKKMYKSLKEMNQFYNFHPHEMI